MLPSLENNHQSVNSTETKSERFLVCGLGSLGQHCVAILKEYGVAVSAIDQVRPKNWEVPNLQNLLEDLFIGDCCQTKILEKAQIRKCRTVLLVTSDERVNIEAAFAARLLNPQVRLVVRSNKQNLNQILSQNLGNFIAFEPNQLTASAFGENILGLFHLNNQAIQVVEYMVEEGDTLNGLMLSDIAYGYGAVPILYQKFVPSPPKSPPKFMPAYEIRLAIGDRMIVLANSHSLQRIERGELSSRIWQIKVEKALTSDAVFDGANVISIISGCDISTARQFMNNLPGNLPLTMYKSQAQRLVFKLNKLRVMASLLPIDSQRE